MSRNLVPSRSPLLGDHTCHLRTRTLAIPHRPNQLRSPRFACTGLIRQSGDDSLGSRLAGCLSMCSVDEFRAALMRAGGNMCIRDRMRGAKFKLVRTRLHREGSGRALARDHSSFALESEFCKRENELRLLDPYRLCMTKTNRCTGQGQTATASARRYRPHKAAASMRRRLRRRRCNLQPRSELHSCSLPIYGSV